MTDTWFHETLHTEWQAGMRMDHLIYRGQTEFQSVLIFDNALLGRVLVLDGVVQTTTGDEFIYHEMLAHVPLLALENPGEVLIIGGGDGGCLEEVLKHPVDRVTMIELDSEVVDLAQEYLGMICGQAFIDPRTELRIEDGAKFLAETNRRFDLIIIDSTDPVGPGAVLFSPEFYGNCSRCLTPSGILVTQNGVPFIQGDELEATAQAFKDLFQYPRFYFTHVPTYMGGAMALGCASNRTDAGAVSLADLTARQIGRDLTLQYYSPAVHQAAFAVPPYVRAIIGLG
ncbi:MAG: polyamine aminopropyltransferase [Alphaproteobacteria bacterium]|jgi:spermidine synthase|nr:polyamine aminopropyltransferase [Alphaproteobacteria bacterium]